MSNGNPPVPPPPPPGSQPPSAPLPQPGVEQAPPPSPPSAPGYAQMPPQPAKKGGCAKPALIALGVLALIVIVVVVVLVVVVGVGVHKAVKEITNRKVVQVAVGQAGKTGDLSIKVNSWQPSPGDQLSTPSPGNQFIVVDLEVTNTGTTSKSVSTLAEMSIRTPNGFKYTLAPYFPEPKYPDGDVLAGQTARGNVVFEVPGNIAAMNFVFEPVLIGDIIEVKLQ